MTNFEQSEPELQDAKAAKEEALNLLELSNSAGKKNDCSLDTQTKELAKFGTFVTTQIDRESYCPGAAHPSNMHSFETLDQLSGKKVNLTDLYSKEELFAAMMENETVKDALEKASEKPKNFDELEKILSKGPGLQAESEHMGKAPYPKIEAYISDDALSNFAFKQVIADHDSASVDTRILLDYSCEAARNTLPYLDLVLPVPKGHEKEIFEAEDLENGFLMKDSAQLGEGAYKHRSYPNPFEN